MRFSRSDADVSHLPLALSQLTDCRDTRTLHRDSSVVLLQPDELSPDRSPIKRPACCRLIKAESFEQGAGGLHVFNPGHSVNVRRNDLC